MFGKFLLQSIDSHKDTQMKAYDKYVEYCHVFVWVRWSFKVIEMALIDTTLYWSAIVSIAFSCTIFSLFDVE